MRASVLPNLLRPFLSMAVLLTQAPGQLPYAASRNVSNDPSVSSNPTVAAAGDQVYAAWHDGTTSSIRFSRSTDGGATFGPSMAVPGTGGGNQPCLAAGGGSLAGEGTVFLGYTEGNALGGRTRMTRSTDGGQTWSTSLVISDPVSDISVFAPVVAVDRATGRIVVSYSAVTNLDSRSEFKVTHSLDGSVWSAPINLSQTPGVHSRKGRVDISGGVVVAGFVDESTPAILVTRISTDGSVTFGPPIVVTQINNPAINTGLDLAMNRHEVSFAYTDLRAGMTQADVFVRRVTIGTGVPAPEINLTNTAGVAERFPKVDRLGSALVVHYEDLSRTSDTIVYRISFDGGSVFAAAVPVPGSTRGGNSSVVTDGNRIILAHGDGNSPSDVLIRAAVVAMTLRTFGAGCAGTLGMARPYLEGFGPGLSLRIGPVAPGSPNLLFLAAGRLASPILILGCPFHLDPFLMIPPIGLLAGQDGVVRFDVSGPLPPHVRLFLQNLQVSSEILTSKPGDFETYEGVR